MGNRYVWGRHKIILNGPAESSRTVRSFQNSGSSTSVGSDTLPTVYACTKYYAYISNGHVVIVGQGNTKSISKLGGYVSTDDYPYIVFSFRDKVTQEMQYELFERKESGTYWVVDSPHVSGSGYPYMYLYCCTSSTGSGRVAFKQLSFETSMGEETGIVTDKTRDKYTDDGPSGSANNDWYKYKGYDDIDPPSLAYSTTSPKRNEQITLIATPSTGKVYGGNVYYWFQYSIDGEWIDLYDSTVSGQSTSNTKTVIVPKTAKTFQARVFVTDNLGYISASYTTGARLNVQSIQAYIGASGTARRVTKMYIGINGVAREVTGGYIGVSGTARKWF